MEIRISVKGKNGRPVNAAIESVYSGRDGKCCCGCSGKHHKIDEGPKAEAQITRVRNIIQKQCAAGAEIDVCDDGSYVAVVVGARLYIAYLAKGSDRCVEMWESMKASTDAVKAIAEEFEKLVFAGDVFERKDGSGVRDRVEAVRDGIVHVGARAPFQAFRKPLAEFLANRVRVLS